MKGGKKTQKQIFFKQPNNLHKNTNYETRHIAGCCHILMTQHKRNSLGCASACVKL